jgi:hypothetical protein
MVCRRVRVFEQGTRLLIGSSDQSAGAIPIPLGNASPRVFSAIIHGTTRQQNL